MVIKYLSKKRKNNLILRKKNYILQKEKNHLFLFSKISSFISYCLFKSCPRFLSLSKIFKIRSTIFSCLSKSCPSSRFLFLYKSSDPKICPILVKVSFPLSIQSNEVQWFPCSNPVLSFFNTLYERSGVFYITYFKKMRTIKIIYSKD
ncbi:hypothetical protein AMTRI_Chr01g103640 [Amborella trichopoda]